jgi:hypothetical protein
VQFKRNQLQRFSAWQLSVENELPEAKRGAQLKRNQLQRYNIKALFNIIY